MSENDLAAVRRRTPFWTRMLRMMLVVQALVVVAAVDILLKR